jgi:serine-type D-Ala-D-Ala carboxypeptidase/endopeptidase (penicillin-binding protein 4)
VTDLPVAGFTGSLAHRFDTGKEAGLGTVRAKTGTLTGVQGLAGTLTTPDGTVMAFVAVADRVKAKNALSARAALDRIAAALAACTCGATP